MDEALDQKRKKKEMDEAGEKREHVITIKEELPSSKDNADGTGVEEELPSSKDNAVRTGAGEEIIPFEDNLPSSKYNAVRIGAGKTSGDVTNPIKEEEEECPSSKDNAVNRTQLMPSVANRSQRRRSNMEVKFKKSDPKAVSKHSKKTGPKEEILEELDFREEIFKKLDELKANELQDKESREGHVQIPKIQKVPHSLRDHQDLKKYCIPTAVSLGPIHHGKYPQAEEVKQRLTYKFIKDSKKDKKDLYKMVEDSIGELKACFDPAETAKYDDKKLAAILFVDGCSVLQFIYYTKKRSKDLKIKKDKVEFGRRDLFLLENQLPYKLLKDLIDMSDKKEELNEAIDAFIRKRGGNYDKKKELKKYCNFTKAIISFFRKTGCNEGMPNEEETTEHIHLLDFLRTSLLANPKRDSKAGSSEKTNPERDSKASSSEKKQYAYRNVQELTAAGIQMKCNKNSLLKMIHFTPKVKIPFLSGNLWLPKITVDESTGPMFVNLIAYERCPDFFNDLGVTSYVSFLDSLIDNANDVQKLKQAGVLENFLSSDEEVAQLFNEIASNYFVIDSDTDAYAEVKYKIWSFSRNRLRNWIQAHQCFNKYFSSPWTMIALIAGIFALFLTSVQTWYAAFPH